jgi:SAM-dependent methyltransferase
VTIGNLNVAILAIAVIALLWNVYFLAFNRGIPNIRTAPAIRRRMIELLKEDCRRRGKKNYTILDLGSGNGLLTRDIARALPEARVIGLEISSQQLAWAKMMKRRQKIRNLEYKKGDFFKYDMTKADAIVLFQLGTHHIGEKLNKDLKKGTLVISNKFPLGDGWKHDVLMKVETWYPFQKKLYIYHKK